MRTDLARHLDVGAMRRLEAFYVNVNARTEFLKGYRDFYHTPNPALGLEVEYFHPTITYDDRMRYICDNIATRSDLSPYNRLGNTIISHFYGARGIHTALTGDRNPRTAIVDFTRLYEEQKKSQPGDYTREVRHRAEDAKRDGIPLWGTTELHTSIQGAGRKFVERKYGAGKGTSANVCEWIASWIGDGTMDRMLGARSFRQLYDAFIALSGVGEYYAYHGAAGVSNDPEVMAYHDERFCAPGPGARETAELLFPNLSLKEVGHAERVIWIREKQHEIMDKVYIHPDYWNITSNGRVVYPEPQDELKVYGTEVCMCQFSVYNRLMANPHLISHRKVARIASETSTVEDFFG